MIQLLKTNRAFRVLIRIAMMSYFALIMMTSLTNFVIVAIRITIGVPHQFAELVLFWFTLLLLPYEQIFPTIAVVISTTVPTLFPQIFQKCKLSGDDYVFKDELNGFGFASIVVLGVGVAFAAILLIIEALPNAPFSNIFASGDSEKFRLVFTGMIGLCALYITQIIGLKK